MLKKITLLSFFVLSIVLAKAQQTKEIGIEEVILKVAKNNYNIKILEQKINLAKAEFNQSSAVFLPSIAVSYTGISTTNPLMAFGSKLNQEVLTQNDFNPVLLNNPNHIENFTTKVEIKQPIFNADGFYKRKAAKEKMNAVKLQTSRAKKYINLEVSKAYMQLQIAYKTLEVLQKAKETTLENLKTTKNYFKQGVVQKADLLLVEIKVAEIKNKVESTKNNIKNASDYLMFLMNDYSENTLKPTQKLTANTNSKILTKISENREDLIAMQKSVNAYKNMHTATKMSFLPKLNAFGSYELHDHKLFKGNANGYLIGAQLSWNIFEGYQRIGKQQQAKANYEKAQLNLEQHKNKSKLEFNKALRNLKTTEKQLQLTQLAVKQSKEALRIKTNRFKEGLEKSSDILLAETQYLTKQLENLQAIFNYNYTKAYLTFLTK